jgi:hypothetical protein
MPFISWVISILLELSQSKRSIPSILSFNINDGAFFCCPTSLLHASMSPILSLSFAERSSTLGNAFGLDIEYCADSESWIIVLGRSCTGNFVISVGQ